MAENNIGHLKLGDINKILEASVHRRWIARNVPMPMPVCYCYILLDRQGNDILEIDYIGCVRLVGDLVISEDLNKRQIVKRKADIENLENITEFTMWDDMLVETTKVPVIIVVSSCQSVHKDNELDLATARDFLREETKFIILYELFFTIPQCELDVGLKIIKNEMDLLAMYDHAHSYGKIHVYITHGPQDLAFFYVENLCFYGSGDEVKSRRKNCIKDAGNMSVEELVSWDEEKADMASKASDDDMSVTTVVDKGKGLADKGKGLANKGKGLADKGKGIMVDEENASRNDIDMEQRSKGSADLEEIPNRVYDVGESDTLIEQKEYMDNLMHQLRDVGNGLIDPFTILENDQANEKFPIHDEQTHWKMRKPKVGDGLTPGVICICICCTSDGGIFRVPKTHINGSF
ncbi:hypothetical protein Tco_1041283 [Tanacetum coccineum]|uniref:Uncharacterized protein n=1 Tax=Tanacetum coccineum TaxID=301880 RepID=A0ABQ5GID1_9ASTR